MTFNPSGVVKALFLLYILYIYILLYILYFSLYLHMVLASVLALFLHIKSSAIAQQYTFFSKHVYYLDACNGPVSGPSKTAFVSQSRTRTIDLNE